MCTSIHTKQQDFYFGRTLDLECGFQEKVVITPRNYPFCFKKMEEMKTHYALIGMASVIDGVPLYAEAANEKGLCMSGLNFPGLAYYPEYCKEKDNVTSSELIFWILGQCANVQEAKALLNRINLVNIPFRDHLPLAPLHWMLSDQNDSIIIESEKDGLHIYHDQFSVMTNNPPYPYHCWNINNYQSVSAKSPHNRFSDQLDLKVYAQGMGAIGLPGDFSSSSRFVKAAFLLNNAVFGEDEESHVTQFFHLLNAISMPKGSVITPEGNYDITQYSCCINATKGIYYYTTYENAQITAIDLHHASLNDSKLTCYELRRKQSIFYEKA